MVVVVTNPAYKRRPPAAGGGLDVTQSMADLKKRLVKYIDNAVVFARCPEVRGLSLQGMPDAACGKQVCTDAGATMVVLTA